MKAVIVKERAKDGWLSCLPQEEPHEVRMV